MESQTGTVSGRNRRTTVRTVVQCLNTLMKAMQRRHLLEEVCGQKSLFVIP